MTGKVLLVVGAAVVGALVILRGIKEHCPEHESGQHEFVPMSEDTDAGRTWVQRCLHCWQVGGPGIEIPWLRKRTFPNIPKR